MQPFGWYRALLANPQYRWIAILGSLIYLISPIDLSPDVIPLVGQIDDVILLTVLFSSVTQMIFPRLQPFSTEAGRSPQSAASERNDDSDIQTVDVKATTID